VGAPLLLVAHSAGCSVVLKYLADEPDTPPLAGLFLIAAPYWGAGGWPVDAFSVDEVQASRRLHGIPMYFYHSRDDAVVPFAHLARHAAAFPHATVRAYEDRGHQFRNDLSDIAADIRRIQDGHPAGVHGQHRSW
jgi:predicted alpha/beta hydrolase family esterase